MSKGNTKRLRWGDFLSLGIAMAVVGLLGVGTYGDVGGIPMVHVETDEDQWIYPLKEDRTIKVPGALGNMVVEVNTGMVNVLEAPCRDKICIHAKPLEAPGHWVACLPSRVFIRIQGEERSPTDDVSF